MRVALVSPLFESVPPRLYGGTERVVYNLCQGLADAGVDVTLFASEDSTAPGRLIPVGGEALRLRKEPLRDPNACSFMLLAEVARHASEFDVIHNHHDYWILPLSGMTDVPLVTTLHGRLDLPEVGAALRAFPGSSFVSISDAQRDPVPGLPWVRTVHHGLDLSGFAPREKPGSYLAFLGRISVEKRPEWAIEIAKRAGIPLKIAAKVEGSEGRDYFEAKIRPHLGGSLVEYLGEISESEKGEFLGGALGLVFPIDWPEPFGLVMIESLACGTPVLARPCGAAGEVLLDGVTGFVSPDLAELARRAPELASLDRSACRRFVEERFSLQRMTEGYIDVYRRVVELAESSGRVARRSRSWKPRVRTGGADRAPRHRRDFLHPVQRVADGDT